jgi:prephenate dehydrogenase
MVVVATRVSTIPSLCLECAKVAREGAIITDVGSVKGRIDAEVTPGMPPGRHFIGSHPLAGSEKRGVANADGDLLAGATCIITPSEHGDKGAVRDLSAFWQAIGMKVFCMSPQEHDLIMAGVSHLPHLVAAALTCAVPDAALPFAASGLRDTTRVAAGDAGLWRDIIEANQDRILSSLADFEGEIENLKGLILRSDFPGVERYLHEAAEKRRRRFPTPKTGETS